jgi:hypothetical protein
MLEKLGRNLQRLLSWTDQASQDKGRNNMKTLRKGPAMRVIFFYPGEEGTYVDNAEVVLYDNGIVHITSNQEETTTHLQNCEILWRFETDAEERTNKVRLLKPKTDSRPAEETTSKSENKSGKGNPAKNPELVE